MIHIHRLSKIGKIFGIFLIGVLLFISRGYALPVTVEVVGQTDSQNRAQVEFNYASGILDVSVTNTSALLTDPTNSLSYDPRITAIAFNLPDNIGNLSSTDFPDKWMPIFQDNKRNWIDTPMPLGLFDIAAVTGPNFNGGSPKNGIAIGDTLNFRFMFEARATSEFSDFDTIDFLNALSYGSKKNDTLFPLAVRFQRTGPNGEGSDVGVPENIINPIMIVPEPSTLILISLGIMLSVLITRSKTKKF